MHHSTHVELTGIRKEGEQVSREAVSQAKKHQLDEKGSSNQRKRDYAFVGQLIKPSGNTFTEGTKKQVS